MNYIFVPLLIVVTLAWVTKKFFEKRPPAFPVPECIVLPSCRKDWEDWQRGARKVLFYYRKLDPRTEDGRLEAMYVLRERQTTKLSMAKEKLCDSREGWAPDHLSSTTDRWRTVVIVEGNPYEVNWGYGGKTGGDFVVRSVNCEPESFCPEGKKALREYRLVIN